MAINYQVDLSILIVNWNVMDYLSDCLDSVYEKTCGITFEIIVIDNASNDGSVEMVRRKFPQVRLVENPENFGFGKSNNLAVPKTRGKFIGLLNPDTILINDAFSIMVNQLENDSKIGIIGPKLLSRDETIQRPCARRFNTFLDLIKSLLVGIGTSKSYNSNYLNEHEYAIDQSVECVSGACMVIRRDIIKDERIFDPKFFLYGEDVDLCYTTIHSGWKVYYLSKALVIHYGGESSKQEQNTIQYSMSSVYYFTIKRYGKLAGYIFRFFSLTVSLIKLLFTELIILVPLFRNKRKWVNRRLAYIQIIYFAITV